MSWAQEDSVWILEGIRLSPDSIECVKMGMILRGNYGRATLAKRAVTLHRKLLLILFGVEGTTVNWFVVFSVWLLFSRSMEKKKMATCLRKS